MSTAEAPAAETGLTALRRRITSGDVGSLPVILGLVLIWGVFQYLNPNFLSPRNLTNLAVQITDIGIVSVGIVLVLLLGEIDLSVGSVYGLGSAVMAVLNVKHGWPAAPSILAGILTGTVIGTLHSLRENKIPALPVHQRYCWRTNASSRSGQIPADSTIGR